MNMDDPKNLYSLTECLAWLEKYFNNVDGAGKRPFKYVDYGRRELRRIRWQALLVGLTSFVIGFATCAIILYFANVGQ